MDQAIVEPIPIILHSPSDKPSTRRPSTVSQQHSGDNDRQSKRDSPIHDSLQHQDRGSHRTDQRHLGLGCFPAIRITEI
jgi:hypothetical protein